MLFKLNCSELSCGTGDDNFCNSVSKEYFVHLNNCSELSCGTGDDNFCNSVSKEYFVHLNRIASLR